MPTPFDNAKLVATLPWEDDWVTAVTFAGPTRKLVAGNRLGALLLYDLPAALDPKNPPNPTHRLDAHTNAITHLVTTPQGLVISASYDHTVALWDLAAAPTGKATIVLDAEARRKKSKDKKIAEAPGVDVQTLAPAKILTDHTEWVQAMALSRDGTLLATGDDAGEIIIRQLPSTTIVKRWKVKGWVAALSIAPDNKTLAVAQRVPLDGDRFRALGLWDIPTATRTLDLMPAFDKKELEFASIDCSPDGALLAVGQGDDETSDPGRVYFLDTKTGKKTRETKAGHQYGVRHVRFTADAKHLLSAGRDTTIRIWSAADGAQQKDLNAPRGGQHKDWMCALALSADEKLIAGADMAGQTHVWSLP